jgi:hypothetical protein
MKTEIQLEQVLELLPTYVNLRYVDYGENLSRNIDSLQACISENSWDKLYEELDDYLSESQRAGLDSYKEELKNDIIFKFDLSEDEADELVCETYRDEIEEALYERDDSDAVSDLLDNTNPFSFFIDTGLRVESDSWCWTRSEQSEWLKKIKRKLNIESKQWNDAIRVMLSQASYGGQLVVYFYESVKDLVADDVKQDWKSVKFTNPTVAIINITEGSGDHTDLTGHQFTMPFNRKNLFIDRYFKYNYVDAVCGLVSDWCKDSIPEFSFDSVKGRKSTLSPLAAEELQDKELTLIYKQGKCTFGDMDISRHRDVYYTNNFPCGNKCPHCGTFWVD